MWLIGLGSLAFGQTTDGPIPSRWQRPNVMVGVGVGRPALVSVRFETWLSSQFSTEVGFGLPELDFDELAADIVIRYRPDALCFGCGERQLLTIGFGIGAVGVADRSFDAWQLALGPDVAVTGVHWFTPQLGAHATVRAGFGPELTGPGVEVEAVDWWSFGVVGLSF